jgi:hypothetical protein
VKVETKVETQNQGVILAEPETQSLLDWASAIEHSELTYFEKARALATRLGAHYREDGLTEIGFWTPRLSAQVMRKSEIYLEVLTPVEAIDPHADEQVVPFRRDRLNLKQQGEFHWGVIAGMSPGDRDRIGSFYWLRFIDQAGNLQAIRDTLPYSLPYGVFGPSELYDINRLQANRLDLEYFRRTGASQMPLAEGPVDRALLLRRIPRVRAPHNILQIHIGTGSPDGTFASLNRLYQDLAEKIEQGTPLTAAEESYIGYDAVQLLPTEPTIEFRDEYSPESEFFSYHNEEDDVVYIELNKPNTQDWGYDVPILGSSATNPALLESLRPDEVVDLIATLHNFPTGPIQIIYDLVYGHADNQSELLLHRQFLKGPNMYGQDLNHQLPMVRAIFLEMQRRKINTGVDGIRVDGGQDFRFFNPLTGLVEYDDAYLVAMSDEIQEIDGHQRLLFTIFEDGRPWPAEGWEDISTYRELIELKPDSFQWGPLIFAHNTPTLKGFWENKWRRVCEVMYEGSHWITGCANHDTVRRGNQVDPDQDINWNLGKTLPEVLRNAYDNAAVTLWVYGFSPGLPMDFINATLHAPWMFFRNTDERYGVKVVSEEIGFLDWQVTPQLYKHSWAFKRLKTLGFKNVQDLREFGKALQYLMVEKDYNLNDVVDAFRSCANEHDEDCEVPKLLRKSRSSVRRFWAKLDIDRLKRFALMFMEDCFEVCNVSHYHNNLKAPQANYNLRLRRFRHDYPWLRENLTGTDRFNKTGTKEATVYYGVRSNPEDESERIAMIAHMGGEAMTVKVGEWLQLNLSEWDVAIASPGLKIQDLSEFELHDSQGVLLKSKTIKPPEKSA